MTSKWKKKTRQEMRKKRGGEKVKSRSQDWCVTFKTQNCLKILLSVHAQTLEADSLHLEQKPRMRSAQPINDLFVAVFIVRQWPANSSTNFKMHFSQKFQGAMRLEMYYLQCTVKKCTFEKSLILWFFTCHVHVTESTPSFTLLKTYSPPSIFLNLFAGGVWRKG